jgi:VanZ family protein
MQNKFLWFLTLSWAGLTLYLTTIPNFSPSADTLFSWLISNGGHFFFFGVLAILLYKSLLSSQFLLLPFHLSLLTSSLYGLIIEYIQLSIPGRSFDLIDWGLDTFGAIIFLWLGQKTILLTTLKNKTILK